MNIIYYYDVHKVQHYSVSPTHLSMVMPTVMKTLPEYEIVVKG